MSVKERRRSVTGDDHEPKGGRGTRGRQRQGGRGLEGREEQGMIALRAADMEGRHARLATQAVELLYPPWPPRLRPPAPASALALTRGAAEPRPRTAHPSRHGVRPVEEGPSPLPVPRRPRGRHKVGGHRRAAHATPLPWR